MMSTAAIAQDAPQIFLDKPPQVVAYQLKRLTNPQLIALERKPDDAKYRPIYEAILERKGVDRKARDEAVGVLAKFDKSDAVVELLDAIGKIDPEDKATPRELIAMLMAQKPAAIAAQREKIQSLASDSQSDIAKQAAYAALAVGDGKPDAVWMTASTTDGAMPLLLGGIGLINDGKLRSAFYDKVDPLAVKAPDEATQVAAIEALSGDAWARSGCLQATGRAGRSASGAVRDAAIHSIRKVPADKWPQDQIEPLATAIVKIVKETPADQRTTPQAAQAVQLRNDLAGDLADEQGLPIKKTLRDLQRAWSSSRRFASRCSTTRAISSCRRASRCR